MVTQKLKFKLGQVGNIVGKEKNAGNQHFLLFPQFFLKPSFTGSLKVGIKRLWINFIYKTPAHLLTWGASNLKISEYKGFMITSDSSLSMEIILLIEI